MGHSGLVRARSLIIALALLSPVAVCGRASAQPTSPQERYGRALFAGQAAMRNGGPPCASCHAISSLGFPNGGAMGPDLSGIYQTLGPDGTDAALQTLFFPTMMPVYDKRPLTPPEQQALKAFLAKAGNTPVGQRDTLVLAGLAVAGFIVLLAITWLAWRGRLRGVRAPLVAGIRAGGAQP
jgi:ubiquinol-cytochrome c reductase cytochrome c subunit